jgi:geranylgeranyl diphosphate synthase type I
MDIRQSSTTKGRARGEITDRVVAYLDPVLRDAVALLSEPVKHLAEYHLGWIDADGNPSAPRGTRRRAATLTLLCAGSDGGAWDRARNAAVAGTLMYTAAVIHDDIIDRDPIRRGRPALWAQFGTPAAIQTGDALLALSFELLASQPDHITEESIRRMAVASRTVCSGQVLDASFERSHDVSLADSFAMVEAKTAAPVGFFCAIGALARNGNTPAVEAAHAFGLDLGMALQLFDDLEGIWGEEAGSMEPHLSDLRTRKKIPVVAFCLHSSAPARARLADYYCHNDTEPDELQLHTVRSLIEECGGRTWLETQIGHHLQAALQQLPHVVTDPVARSELISYLHGVAGVMAIPDSPGTVTLKPRTASTTDENGRDMASP